MFLTETVVFHAEKVPSRRTVAVFSTIIRVNTVCWPGPTPGEPALIEGLHEGEALYCTGDAIAI